MKWFNNPQTLEDLKKQYKRLAMLHHPDRGGNTADMQEINNEYDELFQQLKNVHKAANGSTYKTRGEGSEKAEDFRQVIDVLIRLNGLKIEICGSWIWVTGDTLSHKTALKSLKFKWSRNKKAWYFHGTEYHKFSKKSFTLNEIRDMYGSEVVESAQPLRIH